MMTIKHRDKLGRITEMQMSVSGHTLNMTLRPEYAEDVTVYLQFDELCRMLQVLRGECEFMNDGKGVVVQGTKGPMTFNFDHILEPYYAYNLSLDCSTIRYAFTIHGHEATGLCAILERAIYDITIGAK